MAVPRIVRVVLAGMGAAMVCAAATSAQAQAYPSRPVRVIVPFGS